MSRIDFDRVYCLFEQSGTFKNVFLEKGYKAYDVDIMNEFGQTDYNVDLFKAINDYRLGGASFFRGIGGKPLFLAFFPCTYFSQFNLLFLRGSSGFKDGWDAIRYMGERMEIMVYFFVTLRCLIQLCLDCDYALIIENPYHESLLRMFMRKPDVVDYCRHWHGDVMKKPTGYWFYNCEPAASDWFFSNKRASIEVTVDDVPHYHNSQSAMIKRSMIHPDYARHFVECFILGEKKHQQLSLDLKSWNDNLNFDEL